MQVRIYQIDSELDKRRVKFLGLAALGQEQPVDPGIYTRVFRGELEEAGLEELFRRFNQEGHPLFHGHSMSVSDVVCLEDKAYYCDCVGFREIHFDEDKTIGPENMLRILYVEPGKAPYESEIPYSLEAMQKAVGGLIEPIQLNKDIYLVGNDEAKLLGMEGNRRIHGGQVIIAGPFFVVGDGTENFRSLTDAEATQYMEQFREPEQITREEVEQDSGICFYTW